MLAGHSDWVRDVAWAPNLGLPFNTIASASQVPSLCPGAYAAMNTSNPQRNHKTVLGGWHVPPQRRSNSIKIV